MRVALISLMEQVAAAGTGGGPGEAPAVAVVNPGFLPIAGHSIARHQLGLALALGCTRIVVHAEMLTAEIVEIQHAAEARGARFHIITAARALVGLVAAEDELFVFAEGFLAMPAEARRLLDEAPGVLVLPVEAGVAAGFERIDINHAWAGALRMPGRIVAGLGDLPADWNPVAALLRLAVQARLALRAVPQALLERGRWRLVRTEDDAHAAENDWLAQHTAADHVRSPGEWLAVQGVRRIGPALLHARTRPWVVAVAALVLVMLALGAGWWGWSGIAFALIGLGWVLSQAAGMLAKVEQDSLLESSGRVRGGAWLNPLLDVVLIGACAWHGSSAAVTGAGAGTAVPAGAAWFAPVVLVLLLWLYPVVLREFRWTGWLCDRLLVALVLIGMTLILPVQTALHLIVLALLATALAQAHGLFPNRLLTTGS